MEQIIDIPVSRTRHGGGLPGFHLEQGSTSRGGSCLRPSWRTSWRSWPFPNSLLCNRTGFPRSYRRCGLLRGTLLVMGAFMIVHFTLTLSVLACTSCGLDFELFPLCRSGDGFSGGTHGFFSNGFFFYVCLYCIGCGFQANLADLLLLFVGLKRTWDAAFPSSTTCPGCSSSWPVCSRRRFYAARWPRSLPTSAAACG